MPCKVPLQWPNVPCMGALPMEKGAVMKCTLCRPYMTVPQRVPSPVLYKVLLQVRQHDEVPLQWRKCDVVTYRSGFPIHDQTVAARLSQICRAIDS